MPNQLIHAPSRIRLEGRTCSESRTGSEEVSDPDPTEVRPTAAGFEEIFDTREENIFVSHMMKQIKVGGGSNHFSVQSPCTLSTAKHSQIFWENVDHMRGRNQVPWIYHCTPALEDITEVHGLEFMSQKAKKVTERRESGEESERRASLEYVECSLWG